MSDFRHDPYGYDARRNLESAGPVPGYVKWIYGGIVGALFLAVVLFAATNDGTQVARNQQPGMSTSGETTGSGSAEPRRERPVREIPARTPQQ